jgi:SET domain-containing protein
MGIFIVILTGFLAARFIRDFHVKRHKSCLNKNALKSILDVIYTVFVNKRRKFVMILDSRNLGLFLSFGPTYRSTLQIYVNSEIVSNTSVL